MDETQSVYRPITLTSPDPTSSSTTFRILPHCIPWRSLLHAKLGLLFTAVVERRGRLIPPAYRLCNVNIELVRLLRPS